MDGPVGALAPEDAGRGGVSPDGRAIRVPVPGRKAEAYQVLLVRGGLARLGELAREAVPAHRYAVIADGRVAELYGEAALESLRSAGCEGAVLTFPPGEWNKTREEWAGLSDRLARAGFGRDSAVIALGGGVTGDLAGFVAATYMRGIPVVQVPTSLLAMVDSSVGGKTGLDTDAGKNLIGAFHHPRLVLVDPDLLDTLPRPQLAAGLAEVVKVAAVRDESFFGWLEARAAALLRGEPGALEEAIFRAVGHKSAVVGTDPMERDVRALLNFGHTVGHALELLGGYAVLHGEAVAAGMRAEARLGELMGVTGPGTARRIEALLDACGLDRRLEEEPRPERVWEAMSRDKKGREAAVRCVLLLRVGEVARDLQDEYTFELPADRAVEWLGPALRPAAGG